MSKKQLRLGAFFMLPGHHVAAWRYPTTKAEHVLNFEFIKQQALIAEQAKFDMVFLADGVSEVTERKPLNNNPLLILSRLHCYQDLQRLLQKSA